MPHEDLKESKPKYGWVILGLIFGNLFVEGGVRNSQPVFLPILKQSFGGSAALTAAIFSASGIVAGFTSPILGKLLDKIGPRLMFALAGVMILLGFWASSMVTHMWQLFIFYSLVSTLGYTAIGSFSATAVLAPWFPKSKGVMLGIADSGNPTGQAVITPLTQFTISNFGWRAGFQVIGIIFFLVTTPLNFLFQRKPPDFNDYSINPEPTDLETVSSDSYNSNSEIHSNVEPIDPIEIQKFSAFREPAVWFLLLSRSTGSISHQMTNLHIIAFFVLAGYGEMQSATALGASGLIGIIARPTFGILSDKLGRELVFTIAMGMTFLSIMVVILLTSGSSLWALILFVALTGLSDGLSGLILGAKAADLYPPHVLGSVMGIIDIGRGIGWAAGGILTGLLFDIFGDYMLAYSAAAFLVLLSIGSQWVVKLVEPKKLLPETF